MKLNAADVLFGMRAPAGTVSAMKFPAQLVSEFTPDAAESFQAPLAHVLPAATQV